MYTTASLHTCTVQPSQNFYVTCSELTLLGGKWEESELVLSHCTFWDLMSVVLPRNPISADPFFLRPDHFITCRNHRNGRTKLYCLTCNSSALIYSRNRLEAIRQERKSEKNGLPPRLRRRRIRRIQE